MLVRNARGTVELFEPDFLDDLFERLRILLLKILHVRAAVSHKLQKSSSGVKIVLVLFQVAGEFTHALGEDANLYLRRTGIFLVSCRLLDDSLLFLFGQHENNIAQMRLHCKRLFMMLCGGTLHEVGGLSSRTFSALHLKFPPH
jgi:hypothetical protein